MNRLLIIDGASGPGKTLISQYVKSNSTRLELVKKLTTREPRDYEISEYGFVKQETDLIFSQSKERVLSCEFIYRSPKGTIYGIRKEDIDSIMLQGKHPVIIIRNTDLIIKLADLFKNSFKMYILNAPLDEDERAQRLEELELSDIEYVNRLKIDSDDMLRFSEKSLTYSKVVVNGYKEDVLELQLNSILKCIEKQWVDPNLVFVSMSFDDEQTDVYLQLKSIEGKLNGKKIKMYRSGDDISKPSVNVVNDIKDSIRRSSLIICDITGDRPAVYWELGYAHALSKTIIICCNTRIVQDLSKKIPITINQDQIVKYKDPKDLDKELIPRIEKHLN